MKKDLKIRQQLSPALCYTLVALGAALALTVALYMQHIKGLQPCTMCIIQRYAFVLLGLFAFLAMIATKHAFRIILVGLGIAAALVGMVAALRNIWVLGHPDILCGRDPIELFLNALPTAQWFPKIFVALGLCSDPIPPLLGLPLPWWSLIGLIVLASLLGLSLRRR